jgi:hypothetical protein
MAKYTIELRGVIDLFGREEVENWFKSYNLNDFLTAEQIQVITTANVWSKEKLAKKIVDHYFMREIGFETPYLFRHYAQTTMNEIMEEYLLKIYTKFLEYDPLSSVDYTEEYTRTIDNEAQNQGTSNSTASNTASGYNINNDTPQTNITKQNLNNGVYASSTNQSDTESEIENETLSSNSGTSNTVETYTHTMKGDNGVIVTNQYLIREFRELAVSFDNEIIEKLNKLFMGLY